MKQEDLLFPGSELSQQGARLLARNDGCAVWQFRNESGDGTMTVYDVFPGVMLSFNDFHMARYESAYVAGRPLLAIDHCREERMEYAAGANAVAYTGAGDMKLDLRKQHVGVFRFPSSHYHGLTVAFDLDTARTALPGEMRDFPVTLEHIIGRWQLGGYLNFAVIFIGLAVCSPVTALIALLAAALSLCFMLVISHYSRVNAPVEAQANRDMTGAVLEYARGLAVVKSFGKSGAAMDAVTRAVRDSRNIHLKIEWGYVPGNALHLLALKCGSVGLALAAALQCLRGEMDLSLMLLFVFFSFSIFASLEPISDSAHTLGVIDDAMDQLDALRSEHFIDAGGRDIALEHYDIRFRNVDFGYDSRQVLKNVTFTIPEQTSTAIVGPSGSGKTTICSLLARFYDPQAGSITVGGHDLREFTCDSLLTNISMVFQNVYLFHDTIRANILFGRPDATEDEMIAAAKKARCHDFIMKLPDGYDTVVGEGGGTLSGGEKQRISIARAILKDAPIIILDEATASIDPENEHLIQQALSELTRGKTIITIAHRLATVQNADQILVVEDGRIAQQGTHDELIRQDGLYRRFTEIRQQAEGWKL